MELIKYNKEAIQNSGIHLLLVHVYNQRYIRQTLHQQRKQVPCHPLLAIDGVVYDSFSGVQHIKSIKIDHFHQRCLYHWQLDRLYKIKYESLVIMFRYIIRQW